MHVAYLSEALLPSARASSIQVMRMASAVNELGHEVVLFARPGQWQEDDLHRWYGTRAQFPVRIVGTEPARVIGPWVRAARIVREVRFSFRSELVYGRDLRTALLASSVGVPVAYEVHAMAVGRRRRLEGRLFRNRRGLRRLIFISRALRDDYLAQFPHTSGLDLVVAPDGADPPPPDLAPAALPGRLGAPKVGYVGQLYEGRGIRLALDLARQWPLADFHFVGGDAEAVRRWQRFAATNVHFHGNVAPAEVPRHLAAFDVLLAPYERRVTTAGGSDDTSRWMSPLKIFEYMAHGKPILASDLPALREILDHKRTALLCRPGDVAAWSGALAEATAPEVGDRLGRNAREQFERHHTWTVRASAVLAGLAAA